MFDYNDQSFTLLYSYHATSSKPALNWDRKKKKKSYPPKKLGEKFLSLLVVQKKTALHKDTPACARI